MDGGIKLEIVIFSDEMMIHLKPGGQLTQWRKAGEKTRVFRVCDLQCQN